METIKRITVVVLFLAVIGCHKAPQESADNEQTPNGESSTVIAESAKAKAVAAKEELFKELSGRLMEVIKAESPEHAIEVCSKEANQFAVNVSEQYGVKIGRTALKLRNSKNTAPSWAANLMSDSSTEPQFVSIGPDLVGALLPIKLQQKCLTCHGDKETLAPSVKEQLAKLYPDDTATGFKEGDLRGWFWVEVPTD